MEELIRERASRLVQLGPLLPKLDKVILAINRDVAARRWHRADATLRRAERQAQSVSAILRIRNRIEVQTRQALFVPCPPRNAWCGMCSDRGRDVFASRRWWVGGYACDACVPTAVRREVARLLRQPAPTSTGASSPPPPPLMAE